MGIENSPGLSRLTNEEPAAAWPGGKHQASAMAIKGGSGDLLFVIGEMVERGWSGWGGGDSFV